MWKIAVKSRFHFAPNVKRFEQFFRANLLLANLGARVIFLLWAVHLCGLFCPSVPTFMRRFAFENLNTTTI